MENDSQTLKPPLDVLQLAKAIRFAFAMFIVCIGYFSIRSSLSIPGFEQIFKDMLGGKQLPPSTALLIHASSIVVAVSFLVPLCAIVSLFNRDLIKSFYLLGTLAIITLVEFVWISHALFAPLMMIISSMQGS
jgi:type II secretory pathway component PulF